MYVEDVEDSIINFGVHSTVYTIYVEDVEDVEIYMYLFQEDDLDRNKSWFELGADIGLEIVDDEEVEAEVDQIEADEGGGLAVRRCQKASQENNDWWV